MCSFNELYPCQHSLISIIWWMVHALTSRLGRYAVLLNSSIIFFQSATGSCYIWSLVIQNWIGLYGPPLVELIGLVVEWWDFLGFGQMCKTSVDSTVGNFSKINIRSGRLMDVSPRRCRSLKLAGTTPWVRDHQTEQTPLTVKKLWMLKGCYKIILLLTA